MKPTLLDMIYFGVVISILGFTALLAAQAPTFLVSPKVIEAVLLK